MSAPCGHGAPKEEQAKIVQLPTAKEARKLGKAIPAHDGKMYDGRTLALATRVPDKGRLLA